MPDLAGDTSIGMDRDAVPLTWSTSSFSPMSDNAPPPFGREIDGAVGIAEAGDNVDSLGMLKKLLPAAAVFGWPALLGRLLSHPWIISVLLKE